MRGLTALALLFSFAICTKGADYDELAAWAKQDCNDYHTLVTQTNAARNGRDVAAAMRENVRRQNQTIKILLQFARSHRDLRDAAQLGLGQDGESFWHEHYSSRTTLSTQASDIKEQLTRCLNSVGSNAQEQMVAMFRKYHDDPEVLAASSELHRMWAEHDRKLLEVLR